jgi:outer membrane lipoprotein-sorting protein
MLALMCASTILLAQTAEDLVARNLQAKGGIEKIKAIRSLKMSGKFQQGSFTAQIAEEAKAPDDFRQMFTIQGMTQIQAYDGTTGWQISPFEGRRDPELLGEDDLRDVSEDADFYGPLVDYKEKGNTIEYLGMDTVEGDDAYRLKVTLKNGDIVYYYLDPDTYIEIRTERQQFIRGSVRETQSDLGSYKQVDGVYFPFSISTGPKNRPNQKGTITIEKMEANVNIPDSEFKFPGSAAPKPADGNKSGK